MQVFSHKKYESFLSCDWLGLYEFLSSSCLAKPLQGIGVPPKGMLLICVRG